MLRQPKINPSLVHPSHNVVIYSIDQNASEINYKVNTVTKMVYNSENPVILPCQFRSTAIKSTEFAVGQKAPSVDLFLEMTNVSLVIHRNDMLDSTGKLKIRNGDMVKELHEVKNPNVVTELNSFIKDIRPIGQYDVAYFFRVVIVNRGFDEVRTQPKQISPR